MARTRNIKPGFFTNEDLTDCSPWARLLFAGLWTLADREGRLELRPKRIKAALFPYDDVNVPELVAELHGKKLLVTYELDGGSYLWIPTFKKHQRPHPKEQASVLPEPPSQKTTYVKAVERSGGPCKETASCALPSSNPSTLPLPIPELTPEWVGVGDLLRGEGMLEADSAVELARSNRCTPTEILDLICYWRLKKPAWDVGALYKRILNFRSGQDYTALWHEESQAAKILGSQELAAKKAAETSRARAQNEKQRQQDTSDAEAREAALGSQLDKMELSEIREFVAEKIPALLGRIPSNLPVPPGLLRQSVLLELETCAKHSIFPEGGGGG